MAIIKLNDRQHHFTLIDNRLLRDKRLSWRAKGMLCQLLSMPPNWRVRVNFLVEQSSEKKHVIYAILKELEQLGYIKRERARCPETGRLQGVEYTVYEASQSPCLENQSVVESAGPDKEEVLDSQNKSAVSTRGEPGKKKSPLSAFHEAVFQDVPLTAQAENFISTILPQSNLPEAGEPHAVNQPLIINRYKNKQRKEKTAALQSDVKREKNSGSKQVSAAAAFSESDLLITERLSENQVRAVEEKLLKLSPKTTIEEISTRRVEVINCLLDQKAFTNAGQDFWKKLNTITKMIRNGQWTPPTKPLQEKIQRQTLKASAKSSALQNALQEVTHWQSLLKKPLVQTNKKSREQIEALHQKSLSHLAQLQVSN